jgi:hypothetical protein
MAKDKGKLQSIGEGPTQKLIYRLIKRIEALERKVASQGVATTDALALKEDALGNPGVNGEVLSSTTLGVRSWITN